MIFSRPVVAWLGSARRGRARQGAARQHVPQYGNWDDFLRAGRGRARLGVAGRGTAGPGGARQGMAKRLPVGGITGNFVGNN